MSKKSANKIVETERSPSDFIEAIEDPRQREDSRTLLRLMKRATGKPPKMWGDSIVGFGSYHYVYESGREGDYLETGFSPRKGKMSIYIMSGFESYDDLMARIGKVQTGKSCLYVKRLDDVDLDVLETLVSRSVEYVRTRMHKPAE